MNYPVPKRDKSWIAAGVLLAVAALVSGCNPSALNFLLMPFVDNKEPARCKLAAKDKEVTVAVMSNFARLETQLDVMVADTQLAELFIRNLRDRCEKNKEKVKFVPAARVKSLLNQNPGLSLHEVGKKLKADYVIHLEINGLTLHERSSQLYKGASEIAITACNVHNPREEGVVFQEPYRCEFPRMRFYDTSEISAIEFRTRFLNKIAHDISRNFTSYPPEEIRHDMD